jgi:hypothetical protein
MQVEMKSKKIAERLYGDNRSGNCLLVFSTSGDPITGLKWIRKTTRKIADELSKVGMKLPAASRRDIKVGKIYFYIGETHSFSPNPSSACLPHRKRMGC